MQLVFLSQRTLPILLHLEYENQNTRMRTVIPTFPLDQKVYTVSNQIRAHFCLLIHKFAAPVHNPAHTNCTIDPIPHVAGPVGKCRPNALSS